MFVFLAQSSWVACDAVVLCVFDNYEVIIVVKTFTYFSFFKIVRIYLKHVWLKKYWLFESNAAQKLFVIDVIV